MDWNVRLSLINTIIIKNETSLTHMQLPTATRPSFPEIGGFFFVCLSSPQVDLDKRPITEEATGNADDKLGNLKPVMAALKKEVNPETAI